jgi:hypothetical protein
LPSFIEVMSSIPREGSSSQRSTMLPSPKSPMHHYTIDGSSQSSQDNNYHRQEVIDGEVVRTYESPRRRRQLASSSTPNQRRNAGHMTSAAREEALQAALGLPSSVIIVQGLRRMMNSDEPLYDEMMKEQKMQLQKDFLKDVGVVESTFNTAQRQNITFPPSPPATPKARQLRPVNVDGADQRRFCECCKAHRV